MDWGLLRPHSKNFLLRDELVFYRWVKRKKEKLILLRFICKLLTFTTCDHMIVYFFY